MQVRTKDREILPSFCSARVMIYLILMTQLALTSTLSQTLLGREPGIYRTAYHTIDTSGKSSKS
jgi:hypothetical protein